jgi:PAS domain S-box-containing protein
MVSGCPSLDGFWARLHAAAPFVRTRAAMDIWSIGNADISLERIVRGDAIPSIVANPAVTALHGAWHPWREGPFPPVGRLRRSLPPGHSDFILTLRRTADADRGLDFEYLSYGVGLRRFTGLDLVGSTLLDTPPGLRDSLLPLYGDVALRGIPAYCVHGAGSAPFVRSWQRAVYPCRLEDGSAGLLVWIIPLEYRLAVLTNFLNATDDGMGAWKPVRGGDGRVLDFQCLFANDALCRAAGLGPGQLTGHLLRRDYPDVRQTSLDAAMVRLADAPEGAQETLEFSYPDPVRPRSYRAALARAPDSVLVVLTDLTELEERGAAIAEAERNLFLVTQALDATDVNVTISDPRLPDAPLVFVNTAFCRTTGYARDEVLGRNCRFLQGPETEPEVLDELRRCLRDGRAFQGTLTNYRRDGTRFLNRLHIAPVRDVAGEVIAHVGVQHDVTREEEAREAAANRQRLEALGRLAGGIAHEINNLLQPAVVLPSSVADALPADAAEAREDLQIIAEAARAARDVLRGFLAFTRGDASVAERTDCLAAIAGALDLVEALQPKGLRIVRRGALAGGAASGTCGEIVASRAQAMQVVSNLVSNAAQAMGGRGVVEVGLEPGGGPDRPAARLTVRDHGHGMDEQTRRRIFEPFFTTRGIGEGTGLGLSIVYGIVAGWGGRIEVESAPGEGTTVTVEMPLAAAAMAA